MPLHLHCNRHFITRCNIRFSITRYNFFFNYYFIHYINKSASLQGIAIGSSLQGITIRLIITIRHYITRYYNKTALDILELWSDCAEATVDLMIPLVQQWVQTLVLFHRQTNERTAYILLKYINEYCKFYW